MGRGLLARWGSKTTWRTPARFGWTRRRSARATWYGAAWSQTSPTSAASSWPPLPRNSEGSAHQSVHQWEMLGGRVPNPVDHPRKGPANSRKGDSGGVSVISDTTLIPYG